MGVSVLLLLASLLAPAATAHSSHLFGRDYIDTVCKPATKSSSDTVPPCVEIETIETLCTPNGTEPIYFAAHQQCMCGGSYFAEWPACQACLLVHGLRSEREVAQYDGILSAASAAFCSAGTTPTAVFADVFSSVAAAYPVPTTGATASSDRAPGDTAVSLYYTASGSQGPGPITGAAAAATATALVTAPEAGTSTTAGGAGTGSASGSSGSTRTASNPGTTPTAASSTTATQSSTAKSKASSTVRGSSLGAVAVFGLCAVVAFAL